MTEKTLLALKQSIEHHSSNSKVTEVDFPDKVGLGSKDCALCELFFDKRCHGCPVAMKTGQILCYNTPYVATVKARDDLNYKDFIVAEEKEVVFLESLLP